MALPAFLRNKSVQQRWVITVTFLVAVYLYISNAWVGDDAYISFRYVDNLIHGHGLRYNPIHRVQGFTNPLWVLILTPFHFLTQWWGRDSIFFTALLLQFVIFLGIVKWSFRHFTVQGAVVLVSLMLASRAFLEYNASGLENSLNFSFLLAIFSILSKDRVRTKWVFLLGGLLIFSRLDHSLLVVPLYLYILVKSLREKQFWRTVAQALLAHLPLILWLLFATLYFGSPFPNTLKAKLGYADGLMDRLPQAWLYFMSSLKHDPVLAAVLIVSPALVFLQRNTWLKMLGLGALLYICYVFYVGGDFMSGRFFTSPYWVLILLGTVLIQREKVSKLVPIVAFGIAAIIPFSSHLKPGLLQKKFKTENGIADEKMWYYERLGFLAVVKSDWKVTDYWRRQSDKFLAKSDKDLYIKLVAVGTAGYYMGERGHIADLCGLTDAFIAQLPLDTADEHRVGHPIRVAPRGYKSVLYKGKSFKNPELQALYEDVKLVHQASLFTKGRFKAMWRLHRGFHKIEPGY